MDQLYGQVLLADKVTAFFGQGAAAGPLRELNWKGCCHAGGLRTVGGRRHRPSSALANQTPHDEADVRGTLAQAPHEVRKPLTAEGNIDPDWMPVARQRGLQI